jgi:hypothetical protein
MKQPHLNEIRGLRAHIRVNFLTGRQVYRDQQKELMVEEENLRRLRHSGQLQQGAGRRVGLDSESHAVKLARINFARSLNQAPDELLGI